MRRAPQTPGCAFLGKLRQVMDLVAELPAGVTVEVAWSDASPDLLLVLAQQEGAELHSGDDNDNDDDEVVWTSSNLTIRARRCTAPPTPSGPRLRLVKR